MEYGVYESVDFYHIFIGEDADTVKETICDFVSNGHGTGEYEVSLFRRENGRFFMYSYGELHTEYPLPSEIPEYCKELSDMKYFVLPLKVFAFKCPVCGERTLQYRGEFDIYVTSAVGKTRGLTTMTKNPVSDRTENILYVNTVKCIKNN